MKNKILYSLIMLLSLPAISQDKGKLSFEIGYGRQQISMSNLNNFYLDNFAIPREIFQTNLTTAKKVFMGVRYQQSNYFDFGFYCNSQKTSLNGFPYSVFNDESGSGINLVQGSSNLLVNSFGFGITSNIHLNYFLKLQEKKSKFLNRSKILFELNVGKSISMAKINILFSLPYTYNGSNFQTKNINSFESQIALKFEYEYLKSKIVSGIGIKLGYQYLKTNTLKDQFGEEWLVEYDQKINLDFSGYFAGLYLTISK
jgi:hypothetical protein